MFVSLNMITRKHYWKSLVCFKFSEDTNTHDFAESYKTFQYTVLTAGPNPASSQCGSLGHSRPCCAQRGLQNLLQGPGRCCFTVDSRTPPRALLQHPCRVLENDTAMDLLSLFIAEGLACMDASSLLPAVTASPSAPTKLLGNVQDSICRKALGLGMH